MPQPSRNTIMTRTIAAMLLLCGCGGSPAAADAAPGTVADLATGAAPAPAPAPAQAAGAAPGTVADLATGAAWAPAPAAGAVTGTGVAPAPGGDCDPTGTWAVQIVVPVRWTGNLGVRGGEGEIVQLLRGERVRDGDHTRDTLRVCGVRVPDYVGNIGAERYGVRFPDALFDGDVLPKLAVRTYYAHAGIGASFATEPAAVALGVQMEAPATDPWPARWSQVQTPLDSDGDGEPGITLAADTADGYALPRTSLISGGGRRATHMFTAQRNVVVLRGTVARCDLLEGAAEVPELGGVPALNSHVLGCRKVNGQSCSRRELDLIGSAQPLYTLAGPARARMQRIAPAATCADIRALPLP